MKKSFKNSCAVLNCYPSNSSRAARIWERGCVRSTSRSTLEAPKALRLGLRPQPRSIGCGYAALYVLLLLAGSVSRTAAEPPGPAPGFALTSVSNHAAAVPALPGVAVRPDLTLLQCGNLIYNGNKSSVCFADRFLTDVAQQTNLRVNKKFCPVRLDAEALFDYPFCVMSGNENFSLNEKERWQLRKFLTQGGFLLASPGCSDEKWDQSFRQEIKVCFPEYPLDKIPMTHPVFSMVNPISRLTEKHGKPVMLEGLEINGRLVLVYSKEGLNDVEYAKGCCCCGGNEIQNPGKVNVNIFAYAVLY